jgi:hypothetical protein
MAKLKLLLSLQVDFHYSTIYFYHFINSIIFDYLNRFIKNYFGIIFDLIQITIII